MLLSPFTHSVTSRPHKIATSLPCCLAYFKVTVLLDIYKYILYIYNYNYIFTGPTRHVTNVTCEATHEKVVQAARLANMDYVFDGSRRCMMPMNLMSDLMVFPLCFVKRDGC